MPCGRASFPAQLIREDISEEVAVELGFGWWLGWGRGLETRAWKWEPGNGHRTTWLWGRELET